MDCKLCRDHGKSNCLSAGTSHFRTSTLTRHIDGLDHQLLTSAPKEQNNLDQAVKKASSKEEMAVSVALKVLFWMCKEGIPLFKFKSLIDLFKVLDVPNITHLKCTENCDYTSITSTNEFLKVLSDMIDENITEKARRFPVLTVFVEESTDIAIHHKLAINIRVVDPLTLQPSTFFSH